MASRPYRATHSRGCTTLPRDLDILAPLLFRKPWIMTRRGSSRPADMRNAGQKMQWNREMSLPITCRSAGQ